MSTLDLTTVTLADSRSRSFDPGIVLERLFASVVLFVSTGAVFQLLSRSGGQDVTVLRSSNPEGTILAASCAVTAVLLARDWRRFFQAIRTNPALWILPVLAAISVFWSTDPGRSLRSAAGLLNSMLFATYLALRFDASEQITLVAGTMAMALVASVAMVLLNPSLGIEPGVHQGEWRGIFITKNAFGRAMAAAFMVFAVLGVYNRRLRYVAWLAALSALTLIWVSHSRTALAVASLCCCWLLAQPLLRCWRPSRVAVAIGVIGFLGSLVGLVWLQSDTMLVRSGGEETFTGRTVLWAIVLAKVLVRPVLGYGYAAFWSGSRADYIDVWNIVGWRPPHSHNGFLDLMLDFGVVGLVLVLLLIIATLHRSLALGRSPSNFVAQSWTSSIVVFLIASNLTEGGLLRSNFFWILFSMAAIYSNRAVEHCAPSRTREPEEIGR